MSERPLVAGLLDGLVDLLVTAVQLLLDGFAALINGALEAWPIGMPTLPTVPAELVTAMGWLAWSPIPVAAMLTFLLFMLTVWIAWLVIRPLLAWLKVSD